MELISKKKLLETIEPMVGKFDDDGEFWWSRESILRAINNAPTIEERNEGRWIFDEKGYFFCSECKRKPSNQYATTDYCPNCGAYMIGE